MWQPRLLNQNSGVTAAKSIMLPPHRRQHCIRDNPKLRISSYFAIHNSASGKKKSNKTSRKERFLPLLRHQDDAENWTRPKGNNNKDRHVYFSPYTQFKTQKSPCEDILTLFFFFFFQIKSTLTCWSSCQKNAEYCEGVKTRVKYTQNNTV